MNINVINNMKSALQSCPVSTYEGLFDHLMSLKNVVCTRLNNKVDLEIMQASGLKFLIADLLERECDMKADEPVELGFSQSGFKYIIVTLGEDKLFFVRLGNDVVYNWEWAHPVGSTPTIDRSWSKLLDLTSLEEAQVVSFIYTLTAFVDEKEVNLGDCGFDEMSMLAQEGVTIITDVENKIKQANPLGGLGTHSELIRHFLQYRSIRGKYNPATALTVMAVSLWNKEVAHAGHVPVLSRCSVLEKEYESLLIK